MLKLALLLSLLVTVMSFIALEHPGRVQSSFSAVLGRNRFTMLLCAASALAALFIALELFGQTLATN